MTFDIIVAIDENNLIGMNNLLPWKSPIDLKFFKNKTSETELPNQQNIVIIGRKTFDSIKKPLPNRINCVISKQNIDGVQVYNNIDSIIDTYKKDNNINNIFVIGGSQIYDIALKSPYLRYLYVTHINSGITLNSDNEYTMFPISKSEFVKKYPLLNESSVQDNQYSLKFCKYINPMYKTNVYSNITSNVNLEEYQYLKLLNNIMTTGDKRQTRNAVTISTFGNFLKFSLENHFPILTTKRIYWRGVVEELLWFLKADTNALNLADKKVKIWIPNTTREFLDNRRLSYNVGDIGPMYGFQWLHYGAEYKGMEHNYDKQGFNQLQYCIDLLKNDPYNRRILMTTYNPSAVKQSVLAPCHGIVVQFYVENEKISCHMYQRSSDSFLGLPFNISSYSLLVYIIAKETGLKPGNLYISLGDTHIYDQHIDAVKTQLARTPIEFPKLEFNKKEINEYNFEDFKLVGYSPQKTIKANMIA